MTKRTRTVTETEVKEKEIEQFQCRNCEQWYEQDNIMPVTVDGAFETNVCVNCTENLFGFATETSNKAKAIKYLDDIDVAKMSILYGISGLIIVVFGFFALKIMPIVAEFLITVGQSGDIVPLIAIGWVLIFVVHSFSRIE